MSQDPPECSNDSHRNHPDTYVRRDGHYGSENQYQRWECVPGNGDDPHYLTVSSGLTQKKVGGNDGVCIECLRPWGATDGMPTAWRHEFTVRDIAAGLVRLAEGQSYRRASTYVRRRAGQNDPSKDGRLTRDWVAQYAPELRERYLPDSWPDVLVLDHLTFAKGGVTDEEGTLQPGADPLFHVFGALSYGDEGTKDEARRTGSRTAKIWLLYADTESNADAWKRFFGQLEGQPDEVVCDRHGGLRAALREKWPDTTVFPCTYHLGKNLSRKVRGGLGAEIPDSLISPSTFADLNAYSHLEDRIRYLVKRGPSAFDDETWAALGELDEWLSDVHDHVERSLGTPHAPLSTGGLEKPLRIDVKNALYDRRHLFDNLDRLNHLLVLMALRDRGVADERQWQRSFTTISTTGTDTLTRGNRWTPRYGASSFDEFVSSTQMRRLLR